MTPKRHSDSDPKKTTRKGDAPKQPREEPDAVERASEDSFPASDPPAWEPLHPGTPGEHPDR